MVVAFVRERPSISQNHSTCVTALVDRELPDWRRHQAAVAGRPTLRPGWLLSGTSQRRQPDVTARPRDSATPIDEIYEPITATTEGLAYDSISQRYTYGWQTPTSWAGTCRQRTVALRDGSTHLARFRLL